MPTTPKETFLDVFQQEQERTMRVLRAYPDEHSDFRPHERSNTARQVAWPIVTGQEVLMVKGVTTGFDWSKPSGGPPPAPAKMSEIAAAAERAHGKAVDAIQAADEATMEGTVKFFTAPKTIGDVPTLHFLWMILHDQIHHRGQLSVYLRMVAKVPSIYGPSGDEPFR